MNEVSSVEVVFLPESRDIIGLKKYQSYFQVDQHWNEVGNLAALPVTYNYLFQKGVVGKTKVNLATFIEEKMSEIEVLYKRFGIDLPH